MAKTPNFGVNIFVNDVEKNLEYFTRTLGFTELERLEAEGQTLHALVGYGRGASQIGVGLASMRSIADSTMDYDFGEFGRNIQDSPDTLGNGVFLYLRVPNVDKVYEKVRAKGADIDEPPTDQMWGERTISVRTPDGYYITFAQPIKGFKMPEDAGITVTRGGKTSTGRSTSRTAGARAKKKR